MGKRCTKIFICMMLAAVLLIQGITPVWADQSSPTYWIELTEYNLGRGQVKQLVVYETVDADTTLPVPGDRVEWSCDNENILSLSTQGADAGSVTGKNVGTAHITMRIAGTSLVCTINVLEVLPAYRLTETAVVLEQGALKTLKVEQISETGFEGYLRDWAPEWKSSDESVVSVNQGTIIANKPGTAIISATFSGQTSTCLVTVPESSVVYELSAEQLTIECGKSAPLNLKRIENGQTTPIDNNQIRWYVSELDFVTIKDGMVTALKPGTVKISAKYNTISRDCLVTIVDPAYTYALSAASLDMKVGQTHQLYLQRQLNGKVESISASDVKWLRSGSAITVENGLVTAKQAGTGRVTAWYDNKFYDCNITVTAVEGPASYELSNEEFTGLEVGEVRLLQLNKLVDGKKKYVDPALVKWSSQSTKIAEVDEKGMISATGVGSTVITATYEGKTYNCKVTVFDMTVGDEGDDDEETDVSDEEIPHLENKVKVTYKLSNTTLNLKTGKSAALKMKKVTDGVSKTLAASKVTWKSSKTSVASVSKSGKVTAKKAGTAVITAKYAGKTCKCTVKVTKDKKAVNWKKLYANYITKDKWCRESSREAALIYVNNDNIPEIYIEGDCNASGNMLLTIYNGKVYANPIDGQAGLLFVPKTGLVCESGGHMDYYFDHVGKLANGKLKYSQSGNYGAPDNANVKYDSNWNPYYEYYWQKQKVSEKTYNSKLAEAKGNRKYVFPGQNEKMYTMSQLKKKLS